MCAIQYILIMIYFATRYRKYVNMSISIFSIIIIILIKWKYFLCSSTTTISDDIKHRAISRRHTYYQKIWVTRNKPCLYIVWCLPWTTGSMVQRNHRYTTSTSAVSVGHNSFNVTQTYTFSPQRQVDGVKYICQSSFQTAPRHVSTSSVELFLYCE
jgi:hypothetical protein